VRLRTTNQLTMRKIAYQQVSQKLTQKPLESSENALIVKTPSMRRALLQIWISDVAIGCPQKKARHLAGLEYPRGEILC